MCIMQTNKQTHLHYFSIICTKMSDTKTLKVPTVYEVKNDCCLFERLFKVKKNGVFLLGISFFLHTYIHTYNLYLYTIKYQS